MPIRFECSCGKTIKVPSNAAGRKGRCPWCNETVMVPDESDESSASILPPAPTRKSTTQSRQSPASQRSNKTSPFKNPFLLGGVVVGVLVLILIFAISGSDPSDSTATAVNGSRGSSNTTPGASENGSGVKNGDPVFTFDGDSTVPLLQAGALSADPAPYANPGTIKTPIPLPLTSNDKILWVRFTHTPPNAWLLLESRKGRSRRLMKVDLIAGKPSKILKLPDEYLPEDISQDGNRVMMWPDSKSVRGTPEFVVLTDINTGKPLAKAHPWPNERFYRDLKHAEFHGESDSGIMMQSHYGLRRVGRWNQTTQRLDFQIGNLSEAAFACSPGGRYLIVTGKKDFVVVDAKTGKPIGRLPKSNANLVSRSIEDASFSSDGRFVMFSVGSVDRKAPILIYDLPAARAVNTLEGPRPLKWIDERYALLKNERLYDLAAGMPVWTFSLYSGKHAEGSPDGRHWYAIKDDEKYFLTAATIDPKQILAGSPEKPPLIGPGSTVSILIEGISPRSDRGFAHSVQAEMAAKLNRLDIKVQPGQDNKLVLEFGLDREKQARTYRTFGSKSKSIKIPDETVECHLAFKNAKNRTVWRDRLFTIMPLVAPRVSASAMSAAVRAEQWKDMREELRTVKFPQRIWFNSVRGSSRLTPKGLVKSLRRP